ncbi:hypothetical protein [Pyrococcus horikoshii]|uniref:Uncharacterized protein n=1 Tax=Pyrococcus horikoshii TaxID=53953 RepID=A0A832T5G0_PYRHR|nr:hypothetical protein [Pyrococcus horikoshii]HII60706.1 hypothetical protein [Pyrococcus horikoshii]
MKVKELLKLINEAEVNVRIAIVTFSMRANESPYTSFEFIQESLKLQDVLNDLTKIKAELKGMDPEADIEVSENLIKWLKELINFKAHLF